MNKIGTALCILSILYTIKSHNINEKKVHTSNSNQSFLIMYDNGNIDTTYIAIGNTIKLGDGEHPIILKSNTNTDYPISLPTSGKTPLGIDTLGRLQTIKVTKVEHSLGQLVSCEDSGDILASTVNTPSGAIKIASNDISTSPNVVFLIGVNSLSSVSTPHNSTALIGNPTGNFITVDNSTQENGIKIDTSLFTNQAIILNSGSAGSIKIFGNNIITPTTGVHTLLGLDENNNIVSFNASPDPHPGIFGNLTATGIVSLGTYNEVNNEGSIVYVPSNTSSQSLIITSSNNISINSNTSAIKISGNNIVTPNIGEQKALGIDSDNNIITLGEHPGVFGDLTATGTVSLGTYNAGVEEGAIIYIPSNSSGSLVVKSSESISINSTGDEIQLYSESIFPSLNKSILLSITNNNEIQSANQLDVYQIGSSSSSYISIDSLSNTGIIVNGALKLQNQSFTLPGSGETAMITIDENGRLGILLSSLKFKKNIEKFEVDKDSFDKIKPYKYSYKEYPEKEKLGIIAENMLDSKYNNIFIIKDEKGDPLSIDYNSFFTAFFARFILYKEDEQLYKKKIEKELYKKDQEIQELKEKVNFLIQKYLELK